jgi:hypothetical protein
VAADDRKADRAIKAAWISVLGAVLASVVGVVLANRLEDDPVPTTTMVTTVTSRPTTTSAGTEIKRACTPLLGELRAERDRLKDLHGEVRVQGGHVAPTHGPVFRTVHQQAQAGVSRIADAYLGYDTAGLPPVPDRDTVAMGDPVTELGRTLDQLVGRDVVDRDDAYASLTDWAAKLDNTARFVAAACR